MRTVQVERMRPEEFLAAKKECSVAYLPMGPVEWHGPHMPFGTDPLNAQAIALGAAERLGGVVFPTLFCGTERARTPEQVKWMGFEDEHQYVVGMDVPKNTVRSCYFPEEVFGVILREYLLQILAMDFDVVVMVNGHGADGQVAACQRLARELSATTSAKVLYCFGFDMAGGELDRSKAYDYAREWLEPVLEKHSSIQVLIDLHRDGVPEDRHLVTQINGRPTAQIMFYNGLSHTVSSGDLSYLPNPYIQDNLAFSFQLEYQAALYYPELYRGIYLAGFRYNLHLRPRALLLEAGAQTNTVQEVKNAMEPFADILDRVLQGKK